MGQHFNLPNHSISDMILRGIEAIGNRRELVRLSREKRWTIGTSTLFIPRKGMTNLKLFSPFFLSPQTFLHLFYICFAWSICLFILLHLFFQPKTPGTSIHAFFVRSQDHYMTLLFISSSFVVLSHLTITSAHSCVHVCI